MSKNYAIIIQFVLPLTTFYRSGVQRSNVYQRDVFVTSWRFHNRAGQPQHHDPLPETSGTLWIHRGALTNQRCSLATGCGIVLKFAWWSPSETWHCEVPIPDSKAGWSYLFHWPTCCTSATLRGSCNRIGWSSIDPVWGYSADVESPSVAVYDTP